MQIEISGGTAVEGARLPAPIVGGHASADGYRVELRRDGAYEGWHVKDDAIKPNGSTGLVIVSPGGHWHADVTRAGTAGFRTRVQSPTDPAEVLDVTTRNRPSWLDNHRLADLLDDASIHIVNLATRAEAAPIPAPNAGIVTTIAAGSLKWFVPRNVGRVTRHAVTNFADRPWR